METKRVLVTGGLGYIGSHTVVELLNAGYDVIIYDNLQQGHKEVITAISKIVNCKDSDIKLIIGDLCEKDKLNKIFTDFKVDSVMHFAADCSVPESMLNPKKYFHNNVENSLTLLNCMVENKVDKIIFSSSAAVYGEPKNIPIKETDPTEPTNVYGETKLMFEKILYWYNKIHGIKYVSLRYFNAAGAHPSGLIGEDHNPETHLIPLVIYTLIGKSEEIKIYGNDYPTPDGTCIRDYIHVTDLATAHLLSLEYLYKNNESKIYNLGNEKGFSVKEIINIAEKVTNKNVPKKIVSRRPGDPAVLVASSEKIKQELKWNPQYSDIEKIISTAWNWHSTHVNGFSE
jgi:UDP-glucose 4-epimerase